MDFKDILQVGLDRSREAIMTAVTGLTRHELIWRPGPEANSIGIILFHTVRAEDTYIQVRVLGKSPVWETEQWYQKMNMKPADNGSGLTVDQLATFPVPELKDIGAYAESVRKHTLDLIKGLTAKDLDRSITMRRGEMQMGAVLAQLVVHCAEHAGEISYLRGLQRGMNK